MTAIVYSAIASAILIGIFYERVQKGN